MTEQERMLRLKKKEYDGLVVGFHSFEGGMWIPRWEDLELAPPKDCHRVISELEREIQILKTKKEWICEACRVVSRSYPEWIVHRKVCESLKELRNAEVDIVSEERKVTER
jgi:hypothetical protein